VVFHTVSQRVLLQACFTENMPLQTAIEAKERASNVEGQFDKLS